MPSCTLTDSLSLSGACMCVMTAFIKQPPESDITRQMWKQKSRWRNEWARVPQKTGCKVPGSESRVLSNELLAWILRYHTSDLYWRKMVPRTWKHKIRTALRRNLWSHPKWDWSSRKSPKRKCATPHQCPPQWCVKSFPLLPFLAGQMPQVSPCPELFLSLYWFNSHRSTMKYFLLLSVLFCKWRNWGTERLSILCEVTQPVSGGTHTWTQNS